MTGVLIFFNVVLASAVAVLAARQFGKGYTTDAWCAVVAWLVAALLVVWVAAS